MESASSLRAERDRFLAFAFAAADALIEIGRDGAVRYAAGATRSLFGAHPDELVGGSIFDLVFAASQSTLHAALATADEHGRFAPTILTALTSGRTLTVSGSCMPQMPGSVFLAFSVSRTVADAVAAPAASARPPAPVSAADDPSGRLLDADAFDKIAREALAQRERQEEPYRVNLLDAKGLDRVDGPLVKKGLGHELSSAIARLLKRRALQGAATQLGHGRYAFISEHATPVENVKTEISALVRETAPEHADAIDISGVAFQLTAQPGTEKDALRALRYTLNQFAEGKTDLTSREFAAQSPTLLGDTVARINTLRSVIVGHRFRLAYQPIVSLDNRALHHFEALMRLADQASPASTVLFAEGVGLAGELDLAVSGDVLAAVSRAKVQGSNYAVAVNISGSSLATEDFVTRLTELLRSYRRDPGTILLEITESSCIGDLQAVRRIIDRFRADGYPVCLDDFGAGSSDLQYLRHLAVDFVKIDGAYVRDIRKEQRHVPFVKAITQLCRDLDVRTIAEQIEDELTAKMLAELGVEYGQGYLFGKPAIGLPAK